LSEKCRTSQSSSATPTPALCMAGWSRFFLDSLSGMRILPTLDLRIDYLKPSAPRLDIFARVHCYKTTRNIAFTRGIAYQNDIDAPIAHATGSFMLIRLGDAVTSA
jgi:acyl-coenzyme A thioesterase PaaI-like protein